MLSQACSSEKGRAPARSSPVRTCCTTPRWPNATSVGGLGSALRVLNLPWAFPVELLDLGGRYPLCAICSHESVAVVGLSVDGASEDLWPTSRWPGNVNGTPPQTGGPQASEADPYLKVLEERVLAVSLVGLADRCSKLRV
jgi:hypothetical protein